MTWQIPTPAQITQRFTASLLTVSFTASDGSSVVLDANAPASVEQGLAVSAGLSQAESYRFARDHALEFFPTTATESGRLPDHAVDWRTPRLLPQAAVGKVTVSCSQQIVFPVGTQMSIDGSTLWQTTAEVTVGSGQTGTLPVQAMSRGTIGNVAGGAALTLVSPIAGVTALAVDSNGLAGGTDLEDVESWRARIIDNIRNPPAGGSRADYIKWCKAAGAAYVNPVRGWLGAGTLGVVVAMKGSVAPTTSELDTIQDYLDDETRRPVRANATVVAATLVPQPMTIALNPDTSAVRAQVLAALTAFYAGLDIGAVIYGSKLDDAISTASGETSHKLLSPSPNADTQLQPNQVAAPPTITWAAYGS